MLTVGAVEDAELFSPGPMAEQITRFRAGDVCGACSGGRACRPPDPQMTACGRDAGPPTADASRRHPLPHHPVVLHHADRVGRSVPPSSNSVQPSNSPLEQAEKLRPGILLIRSWMWIVPNRSLHQPEIGFQSRRPPCRSVAVPADRRAGWLATSMIVLTCRQSRPSVAVDFQANLHAVAFAVGGHLVQRAADLLDRLLRPALPAANRWAAPSRPCRRTSWHRRMKALVSSMFFFTTAGSGEWYSQAVPRPDQLHAAVGKPLGHFRARPHRQRGLDAVLVRRPQLDAREAGRWQFLISVGKSHSAPHMYVTSPSCMVDSTFECEMVLSWCCRRKQSSGVARTGAGKWVSLKSDFQGWLIAAMAAHERLNPAVILGLFFASEPNFGSQ